MLTVLCYRRLRAPRRGREAGRGEEAVRRKIFVTSPDFLDYFSSGLIFP
jgi:hypothetical protein